MNIIYYDCFVDGAFSANTARSIEITRSCFLSPKTFNKLTNAGAAQKGMTAQEAGGTVFSPASRANANVLRELLG